MSKTYSDGQPHARWQEPKAELLLPYFEGIPAGFPSPATDYLEQSLDLTGLLIPRPAATFLCRVSGDSMSGDGIGSGDLIVVDKSIEAAHGKVAVVTFRGETVLKRIRSGRGATRLVSSNPAYPDIELFESDELSVWGIVTFVIKRLP